MAIGGSGVDYLYGHQYIVYEHVSDMDNDTIFGGSGNDGVYGNDFLNGESGNDTLVGGAGVDQFVFLYVDNGINVIEDFTIGEDRLSFLSDTSFTPIYGFTFASIDDLSIADNAQGNAVIDLGNILVTSMHGVSDDDGFRYVTDVKATENQTIELLGVSAASLSDSDFIFNGWDL